MSAINIKSDIKGLTKVLTGIQRKIIPLAVPAAMNKTVTRINTQVRRAIATELGVPQKVIKSKIKVFRATKRNWDASNWVGLRSSIPVSKVFHSAKKQINYAKGRMNIAANKLFGATMPTGHQGVFYRKTKKRLPIQEVMIHLDEVAPPILIRLGQQIAGEKFRALLAHELNWRLRRVG